MSERWPALMPSEMAAEYLGISCRSLKRLQGAGRLLPVAIRDGSFLRFRRTDLDNFIEELPYGSGICAANEKRIAVMMLAKQERAAARRAAKGKATNRKPSRSKSA